MRRLSYDVEELLAEPEARTLPDSIVRSLFSTDSDRRTVMEGWFLRLYGPLKAETSYSDALSHLGYSLNV